MLLVFAIWPGNRQDEKVHIKLTPCAFTLFSVSFWLTSFEWLIIPAVFGSHNSSKHNNNEFQECERFFACGGVAVDLKPGISFARRFLAVH